ncbi:MAG: GTP cyclohydrolase I FolE [Oscillospiraceae bacterium]|nr:GTP cyclohydrolase I FolE [Oscillospiraceae bacterium]
MIDKKRAEAAIRELLYAIGDDPEREGLQETPARVANMYEEIFCGLTEDPKEVLKYFDEDFCEEMVVVKDIAFHSMCEHHLLPFFGVAHICYIPAPGHLLGLSKLARIVEHYARRPQLQEKMGGQIADLLEQESHAAGVAVVIDAEHLCMAMRGVKKIGSKTVTTALRGKIKAEPTLRAEALDMLYRK